MLSKGITHSQLTVFASRQPKSLKAIDIYFWKHYQQHYSNEDFVFLEYLDQLVNKKNGFVAKHSSWIEGGALHISSLHLRPKVVGAQNDQAQL